MRTLLAFLVGWWLAVLVFCTDDVGRGRTWEARIAATLGIVVCVATMLAVGYLLWCGMTVAL